MIIDADVEQLIIDYLAAQLPPLGVTAPVADRVPADSIQSVTVIRTGGVRRDLVTDEAQITVDVRAATNADCVHILNLARALLNDLYGRSLAGHAIYTTRELSGPYSNPTKSDLNRYSQSFLVAVRAARAV